MLMKHHFTIVLLMLFLAGCGASGGTGTAPTATPGNPSFALPTPTALPLHHWKIGEIVETGTWEITLTQANGAPDPSTPSSYLLLIALTLKNTTPSSQVASTLSFTLQDQQGKTYNSKQSLPEGYPTISGMVPAHSQVQGWLGFEVPLDQHQFTLLFATTPNMVLWDISIFTDALLK
jgi:hypothetical protein